MTWTSRKDGNVWLIEDRVTNPPKVRLVAVAHTRADAAAIAAVPNLIASLTAIHARATGDLLNPALHPHAPMGEPVADCERISATALERLLTQLNGG